MIYHDECVGLQRPVTVELVVTQRDPGVRGNSATGRTKAATPETGLVVQAPNRGARVRAVDVDFVRNIFDLRIAIEAMLARRAAERMEPPTIVMLEAAERESAVAAARTACDLSCLVDADTNPGLGQRQRA